MASQRGRVGLWLCLGMLAASCTRTYHDVVPGVGTVTVRESYPSPEPIRTKKDLKLPADLRASLVEYRLRNGYWPQTSRALELDSDAGRTALWNMRRQGYEFTELLCRHPDTLAVEFIFGTETKWHLDRDNDGIALGRYLRGRFLFVADKTDEIVVWKTLDNTWRPGHRELVSTRLEKQP